MKKLIIITISLGLFFSMKSATAITKELMTNISSAESLVSLFFWDGTYEVTTIYNTSTMKITKVNARKYENGFWQDLTITGIIGQVLGVLPYDPNDPTDYAFIGIVKTTTENIKVYIQSVVPVHPGN